MSAQATQSVRLFQPRDEPAEPPPRSSFSFPSDGCAGPAASSCQTDKERRRYPRLPLRLHARYMLEDGSEFSCQTLDVSPMGIAFSARPTGAIGERVVAYVDKLGRIEGAVVRRSVAWFAVEIAATPGKLEKLARKINSLVQREDDGLLDRQPSTSAQSGPADAGLQPQGR
jgi:PilZ domain-containing protein